jgi:hypothetical protein
MIGFSNRYADLTNDVLLRHGIDPVSMHLYVAGAAQVKAAPA